MGGSFSVKYKFLIPSPSNGQKNLYLAVYILKNMNCILH